MAEETLPRIKGYHAHVYFDVTTLEQARALCEEAARCFPLKMGRVHERLVGPHPAWSCQLAFRPELFGELLPWLMQHRCGLDVLVHPITGHELRDHRDWTLWLGQSRALDLSTLDTEED
nr:DOPA 4,5-dioxygenase family protein [uncultured Pseudomonas sp.]